MNSPLQCIFTTQSEYTAGIVKAILEDNDVKCFILSKKDSAYLFGEIELYVASGDVLKAKQILNRESFE